jgi:uncharacterized protein YbjT (DUF2867 family)
MYLIAGVTGNTGSEAAAALLARGEPVRVLVRDEAKGEPWRARGADVAVGLLDDARSLSQALKGADGLYFLVPPNMTAPDINAHYRRFVGALTGALSQNKLAHVVYLSTWGAHLPNGPFPMHFAAEQAFRSLDTPFTLLRASFFMENTAGFLPSILESGVLPSFFAPDRKLPMVAAKDIGQTAAAALIERPSATRVIELTGPAEYSMNEVAEAFSRAVGKPVRVAPVPEDQIVPAMRNMGASDSVARFFQGMSAALGRGEIAAEGGEAQFIRGKVTLDQFVHDLLQENRARTKTAA